MSQVMTEPQAHTGGLRFRLPFKPNGLAMKIALLIMATIVLCALFAPWIVSHSPYTQAMSERLIQPFTTWDHPLGTDHLGRDFLSRLVYGARYSLIIGFTTVLLSGAIGITLGLLGGYFGGKVDLVVMYILNVRLSMPIMLATMAIVGLVGNSLMLIITIMSLFLWDHFLVVTRAMTLRLQSAEFVLAAKATGYSNLRIMASEILPNLVSPLLVVATLEMAHAIMLEAAFSFLGMGIKPPDASWGLMIAEAKDLIFFQPWLVTIPGTAIFLLIMSITVMGEHLKNSLATKF
jgi:peptide/nickel transport system permease protein